MKIKMNLSQSIEDVYARFMFRKAEIMGLEWKDIDSENNVITYTNLS